MPLKMLFFLLPFGLYNICYSAARMPNTKETEDLVFTEELPKEESSRKITVLDFPVDCLEAIRALENSKAIDDLFDKYSCIDAAQVGFCKDTNKPVVCVNVSDWASQEDINCIRKETISIEKIGTFEVVYWGDCDDE